MVCWICAGLTFWGAVGALGLCAAMEIVNALRRARRGGGPSHRGLGHLAG
jgi:hypothetical protein